MTADPVIRLVVSIVTWRAAQLTIDCLASLETEVTASPDIHVYVVDNDSGDGTADAIAAAIASRGWSAWAELIRSPVNGGFAAGNNIVFREALRRYPAFEYVLLLNPDTVVRPGALSVLRQFMDLAPGVGIAGGRCEDPDGTPQDCCFRFPGIISEFSSELRLGLLARLVRGQLVRMGDFEQPVRVGWVAGALMIVRRSVLEDIGLMDEGYFLYYEETDFSLRAQRAGWPTWHVPASRAVHFVGQLTGIQASDPRPKRRPAYLFESRRRYFVLNHGFLYALLLDIGVVFGNLLWKLRRLIERKPELNPPFWIHDLVRLGVLGRGRRNLPERRIH
jgi:N-acetylglucosaminyl-diphospho-decaprenol L-rhamnosyltransferase